MYFSLQQVVFFNRLICIVSQKDRICLTSELTPQFNHNSQKHSDNVMLLYFIKKQVRGSAVWAHFRHAWIGWWSGYLCICLHKNHTCSILNIENLLHATVQWAKSPKNGHLNAFNPDLFLYMWYASCIFPLWIDTIINAHVFFVYIFCLSASSYVCMDVG